jgi:hypothetical protein
MKRKYWVIALLFLNLSIGCGDMRERKKNIYGKYYLVESEEKDNFSICYKTKDGDFIGRIPNKVKEYVIIGDSLIVTKTLEVNVIKCYLLEIKNDSDYADKEQFLKGPFDEKELLNLLESFPKFIKVQESN